jgi:hypothetical protein
MGSGRFFNIAITAFHFSLGSHWRGSLDILGKEATNTRSHITDNGSGRFSLRVRVENAVAVGKLIGVTISSASDGAPIVRGAPVRRRFAVRARSDIVRVRV